jgi:basic membrane protein A
MIGQTLNNRYAITARLGKGAMGIVYRATDIQSRRDVALKVISSELAVEPDMLERFKREGEALRQLKHPNIVGFMDAFQHDEHYVIVMEYVSGGSLHELIKAGPLPIERARQISLDLCDALIRAHRLNIIHRDIKPENILIDEDGTPKLADFGVARLSEGTRMTKSGTQVGTPYYMSPEAWEGKPLDAQTDIWSLGVILFEMLTGQVPFGGDTGAAVMNKVLTAPPPDLKKLRTEVPTSLVKIVRRLLTRDKTSRYQTMRQVAVDLESGQQGTTPKPAKASRTATSSRPAFGRYGFLLIAGILIAGVFTAITLLSPAISPSPTNTPQSTKAPTQTTIALSVTSESSTATEAFVVEASGDDCASEGVFCVGLVTDVGTINDKSFNQSAWEGVQLAEQELGAKVQFIETTDARDYDKNIATFGDAGYDVIVTVGFALGEATIANAAIYPDIKFIGLDQFQPWEFDDDASNDLANIAGLGFPEDQAGFLVGALAAMMTQSHKIGAVCGTDVIPPVWRFGEGYRSGATYADGINGTTTEVLVVYHSDVGIDKAFTDPEWGAVTATAIMDQGADVIFGCGGITGNGAITAAAQADAYVIGVDTDQYLTLPEAAPRMLSSALKLMSPGVFDLIKAAQDGTFTSGNVTGDAGYAPFHDLESEVPVEVKTMMEEISAGLLDRSIVTNVPPVKP